MQRSDPFCPSCPEKFGGGCGVFSLSGNWTAQISTCSVDVGEMVPQINTYGTHWQVSKELSVICCTHCSLYCAAHYFSYAPIMELMG